jgi:hypothetical protein
MNLEAQIAEAVRAVVREELARALPKPPPKLLSRRAAARMLGVDRGSTLAGLIRSGHLRLVMGRIPASEIERLVRDGLPPVRHRVRRGATVAGQGGEIRQVPV